MKQKIIVNLYVPINSILTCDKDWRQALNLPELTNSDTKIINELRRSSALPCVGGDLQNTREIVLDSNLCIRKIKNLSFYSYLLNRLLEQAKYAAELGVKNFLVQNSNAPYFNKKQPVVYWIMRSLVSELKLICPDDFTIGLKLNENLDDWALDIAGRNKINYVLCKNNNVADLCLQRQLYNFNVKIYTDFSKQSLSINQQGFVFQSINEKNNVIGCRNYLQSLLFYPKDKKVPVIMSIWDLIQLPSELSQIEFIIFNSCFSNNGFCDCGLDKKVLKKFIEMI